MGIFKSLFGSEKKKSITEVSSNKVYTEKETSEEDLGVKNTRIEPPQIISRSSKVVSINSLDDDTLYFVLERFKDKKNKITELFESNYGKTEVRFHLWKDSLIKTYSYFNKHDSSEIRLLNFKEGINHEKIIETTISIYIGGLTIIYYLNETLDFFEEIHDSESDKTVYHVGKNNLEFLLKKNSLELNTEDSNFITESQNIFNEFVSEIIGDETRMKNISDELISLKKLKEDFNTYINDNNLYYSILKNNQNSINEIDRDYVQKFVKLNTFLKEKRENLKIILDKTIYNLEHEPKELFYYRKNEINFYYGLVHSYNLMINNSILMVVSLVEDDTVTFYEIYELFDKVNVFNTNWENEVNQKLSDINQSLQGLNFSIQGLISQIGFMEKNILKGLLNINTSIGNLENSVNKQLSETNSRLKYENLTNYYKKSTLPGVMDWFDGLNSTRK